MIQGSFLVIILSSLIFVLPACRKTEDTSPPSNKLSQENSVQVDWSTSPSPLKTGDAQILFKLADNQGHQISKATVELEATMTHPGMPSQYLTAEEISPGMYKASLNISMPGDWVIFLKISSVDGQITKKTLSLSAVK